MNISDLGYTLGYIFGILIPTILCGLWLNSKKRSLWHLAYLPILGIFALLIYALMKKKGGEQNDDSRKGQRG